MEEKYMNIHFRLYDNDIIKMTEKVLEACPEEFTSKEDLCRKIAQKEIRRLYSEICGQDSKADTVIDEAEITLRLDQCFILINIGLKLLCALLNIETDKLMGGKIEPENISEGLYDELPQRFRKLIETLIVN